MELVLAPIRGITDRVYREAFARCFGSFDRAMAPFVKLRKDKPLLAAEKEQLSVTDGPSIKTVPQVHTNHARSFLDGLHELRELGHDEVNWNLGCPYPMVAKRRRGAGLLPYPETIDSILADVMPVSPVKLSVKIRLGYSSADELLPVLNVLNRYPLSEVIVHPRTAEQMYGGEVDLDKAVIAFDACRHPFVYNGDIDSVEAFARIEQRLPKVTCWMLGRGALKNPFLPQQLKGLPVPGNEEARSLLWEFHDQLADGYLAQMGNAGNVVAKMKEHWLYMASAFGDAKDIRKRLKRCKNWEEYVRVTANLKLETSHISHRSHISH